MQPEPFFSGAGLDRADAIRVDEAALRDLLSHPEARELQWHEGFPQLTADGRLSWMSGASADLFLGIHDEIPHFSAIQDAGSSAFSAFPLLAVLDPQDAPIFAAALSLSRWHVRHRFCANCGHLSDVVRGGWARQCPACSAQHFPRVDPVVIMLAVHDDRLLLGRQPHYPPGRYSALAGFVEVGETLEAAVSRELFEEAGIRVSNVKYVASQPWPFPSSLMIGCTAAAHSGDLTIDVSELEDARWFTRAEVVEAMNDAPDARFQPPPRAAIARTLLEHWLGA